MAGVGSQINLENFKAIYGDVSWRSSTGVGGGSGSNVFYVAAPTFYVTYELWGSGLWGYQAAYLYVDYFDPTLGLDPTDDSSWVNVYGSQKSGRGSSFRESWNYYHNGENASSGDISTLSMWRLRQWQGDNDGGSWGHLYVGGMENLTSSQYESFRGKKIIGLPCGVTSECWAYDNNSYRGTKISIASETYKLMSCRYA